MKNGKRILALVLTVCMLISVLALAGCGTTATPAASSTAPATAAEATKAAAAEPAKPAEPVKLTIWWAEGDQFKAILLDAINQFRNQYPNVQIEPVWQPNFDTYDKLKVAIAGNSAPDMTKLDSVFAPALGYKNQLVDLNTLGANDVKDLFIQPTWNATVYQGKQYGLPFDANTIAFFYNKDILDKAGVQPPKTYDEIISAGKAIDALKLPDTYAYTVPVTSGTSGWLAFQWLFWLWREGGEVLNADWTKATYNSPEGVAALQKIIDLTKVHKVVPENIYLESEFYLGKVGMLDMGCWAVPTITGDAAKANFGIVPMPTLKDGVPGHSGLGLYSLGILSNCKDQKDAFEFLKSLATSQQYQVDYAKDTNLMPSLISTYNDEHFKTPAWQAFLEQLKVAKSRPGTPVWPEIAEHMNVAIQEALTGQKDAQKALDDAVAKSNEALATVK